MRRGGESLALTERQETLALTVMKLNKDEVVQLEGNERTKWGQLIFCAPTIHRVKLMLPLREDHNRTSIHI